MDEQQRAVWDGEAATFDQEADHGLRDPETREAWRRLLLPLLPGRPHHVADLGCGTGTLSVLLAEAGHRVQGVDFSPRMLALARSKAAGLDPAPAFTEGDAGAPPLPAGVFDVVLSRHVLWALPDQPAVLDRWRRLLCEGGQLVLVEGSWSTGVGLAVADALDLVAPLGDDVTLTMLHDPVLWGKDTGDERYLLVVRPRQRPR